MVTFVCMICIIFFHQPAMSFAEVFKLNASIRSVKLSQVHLSMECFDLLPIYWTLNGSSVG